MTIEIKACSLSFRIASAEPELENTIRPWLEHFPGAEDAARKVHLGKDRLLLNGSLLEKFPSPEQALVADRVLYWIKRIIVERDSSHLFLHASAVTYGGRAFIFAGDSGSGKSTLAAWLCSAGAAFVSDYAAPLTEPNGYVAPLPFPIEIVNPPPHLIARLKTGAGVRRNAFYHVGGVLSCRFLPQVIAAAPVPAAALFFLKRIPGADTRSRPLDQRATIASLAQLSLNGAALGHRAWKILAHLADRVPAYELVNPDLKDLACPEKLAALAS